MPTIGLSLPCRCSHCRLSHCRLSGFPTYRLPLSVVGISSASRSSVSFGMLFLSSACGIFSSDPFAPVMLCAAEFGLQYWVKVGSLQRKLWSVPQTELTYELISGSVSVRVNISPTPPRSWCNDTTGCTYPGKTRWHPTTFRSGPLLPYRCRTPKRLRFPLSSCPI